MKTFFVGERVVVHSGRHVGRSGVIHEDQNERHNYIVDFGTGNHPQLDFVAGKDLVSVEVANVFSGRDVKFHLGQAVVVSDEYEKYAGQWGRVVSYRWEPLHGTSGDYVYEVVTSAGVRTEIIQPFLRRPTDKEVARITASAVNVAATPARSELKFTANQRVVCVNRESSFFRRGGTIVSAERERRGAGEFSYLMRLDTGSKADVNFLERELVLEAHFVEAHFVGKAEKARISPREVTLYPDGATEDEKRSLDQRVALTLVERLARALFVTDPVMVKEIMRACEFDYEKVAAISEIMWNEKRYAALRLSCEERAAAMLLFRACKAWQP